VTQDPRDRPAAPEAPPADTLATLVRAEAVRRGLGTVAFTRLAAPRDADRLPAWLAAGYHGEMAYLARRPEERASAEQAHPWARTMICVLRDYHQDLPPAGPLEGRVSVYAVGRDYHDVLGEDLRELATWLQESFGARTRIAVDSSALLERQYAREAGLGWIGKHTLLLRRDRGSWFFLGEIVTDLDILPDDGDAHDHCGSCERCLDVCPTRAFPRPYVLDARRCISYLTIEHRGVIPPELRPLMGSWVFGCDLCQDVCPWNRYARSATGDGFRPRGSLPNVDLAELVGITDQEFRDRFRGSPIFRAKRNGLVRNAVIALGNSGSKEAVAPLRRALEDESWLVRLHAAWALGRLLDVAPAVRPVLEARCQNEDDDRVRAEIRQALCYPEASEEDVTDGGPRPRGPRQT